MVIHDPVSVILSNGLRAMKKKTNISEFQDELVKQVADLDEKAALTNVSQKLEAGCDPYQIIALCKEGVHQAGIRYEKGQYFVAGLIMAGVILRNVIDLIQPELSKKVENVSRENIVIGTIKGDIHDIGKNLGGIILSCEGFNVIDLGVDIAAHHFIEAIKVHQPRIIVLSCMLTTAFDSLKTTTDAIKKAGLKNDLSVLIAGSLLDDKVCRFVQADHWTNDAIKGVLWCKRQIGLV